MICHFKYSRPKFDKFWLFLLTCSVCEIIWQKPRNYFICMYFGVFEIVTIQNTKYEVSECKPFCGDTWSCDWVNILMCRVKSRGHSITQWCSGAKKQTAFNHLTFTRIKTHTHPTPWRRIIFFLLIFFPPWRILMTALSFWGPWEA